MPWTGSPGAQSFQRTDGTRTGSNTWAEADAAGVDIVAPDHDLHDQDLADGLTSCLKNDGGNSATANIPMGGFRLQNLGAAVARTDSIKAGDVQDNLMSYCSVSGTANAINLTNTVPITTYRAGQEFRFQAVLANTGPVTVAVDGLPAKAVNVAGTALTAGQILVGAWITIAFDGTDFEMAIGTTPAAVSVSSIMAWPLATVPSGWLECDGSAVSRTTYAALFSVIGTAYGTGNGTTTFNLPNYKDQFLRGFDSSGTDASSRTDRGDGTTGANVGTKQTYDTKQHTHAFTGAAVDDHKHFEFATTDGGNTSNNTNLTNGTYVSVNHSDNSGSAQNSYVMGKSGNGGADAATIGLTGPAGGHTPTGTNANYPSTGGNETRPKNITVKWIILAVPSASVAVAQVAPYFVRLVSDRSGSDVNTAQDVFDTGASKFLLPGSTTYEFEAIYYITRSAGTTSHTTSVLFGGTASIASIAYTITSTTTTGAPTATTNCQKLKSKVATATVATTTSTSATENIVIELKGILSISASGTIIPQFQYSAAPGGAPTIEANSYFKLVPLGSDTVASVGPVQ